MVGRKRQGWDDKHVRQIQRGKCFTFRGTQKNFYLVLWRGSTKGRVCTKGRVWVSGRTQSSHLYLDHWSKGDSVRMDQGRSEEIGIGGVSKPVWMDESEGSSKRQCNVDNQEG